jgi:hypothetical protein
MGSMQLPFTDDFKQTSFTRTSGYKTKAQCRRPAGTPKFEEFERHLLRAGTWFRSKARC